MPPTTALRRLCLLGFVTLGGCADRVTAPLTDTARPSAAPRADRDDDDEDDDCGDDDDPCFLRADADAPALAQSAVSFYAVRGRQRSAGIFYRPRPGASDSTELVRLTVPAGAALRRPNGALVAPGDSVRITLTVVDPARGVVSFQPSGLSFGAATPAALRFSFAETDDDVNGDGARDAADEALRARFAVWRQANGAAPWAPLPSTRAGDVVTAAVPGFTNYAIAY
jgi:hypothetical protein